MRREGGLDVIGNKESKVGDVINGQRALRR